MSKNSKKGHISLHGLLTIINVLIIAGFVLLFVFGPDGASSNVKTAVDFLVYLVTLFQVNNGGFVPNTGAIILTLFTYIGILLVFVVLFTVIGKKAAKSLTAVVCFLLSTALAVFGASFYFSVVADKLTAIKPENLLLMMAAAILIVISYVLSLISVLSGTLGAFKNEIGGAEVREIVREVPAETKEEPVKEEETAEEPVEEPAPVVEEKKAIVITVKMIRDYVTAMSGDAHPVVTEAKDANGENGPVSLNVSVSNMALAYGKDVASSLLIRLDEAKAKEIQEKHSADASNFAGSGDYYKLLVNDGSFYEEEELNEILEASYEYVLNKYFKVENGQYVSLEEEPVKEEEPAPVVVPVVEAEETEKEIIERVPFADKVRRSDRDLKNKYDELKAYLLSYGLKSRISIDGDTYRLHKVKYCVITIAGKKMKLYFALNPNDYLTSTIPVKEAKAKKYSDVKALLDVKSDLSVKRAKVLIDTVMSNAGILQGTEATNEEEAE